MWDIKKQFLVILDFLTYSNDMVLQKSGLWCGKGDDYVGISVHVYIFS